MRETTVKEAPLELNNASVDYRRFKDRIWQSERERLKRGEKPRTPRQIGNALLQLHILDVLTAHHVSMDRAIHNETLRQQLNLTGLFSMGDSRPIRQAVNEMRKMGIPVCSDSSHGYWWPAAYREGMSTSDELDNRARDIQYTKGRFIDGLIELFGQQERMI